MSADQAGPAGGNGREAAAPARAVPRRRRWTRRAVLATAILALGVGSAAVSVIFIAPHLTSFCPAPAVRTSHPVSPAAALRAQPASKHPAASASASAAAAASAAAPPAQLPSFSCKILEDTSTGAETFHVTTGNGLAYAGLLVVSFRDAYGDIFPSTEIAGAGPDSAWLPVPAADIGASAEPSVCSASAA